MPRNAHKNRFKRRRTRTRSRSRKRTMSRGSRSRSSFPKKGLMVIGGFPKRKLVKLVYVDTKQFDVGINAAIGHVFRLNSCFDPDLTGTGHQPYAFDQWSTFYNRYTVIGAKITCTFWPNTADAAQSATMCGIEIDRNNSITTNSTLIQERPHTFFKTLGTSTASRPVVISRKLNIAKFFGEKNILSDDDFTPTNTGNPFKVAHGIVYLINTQGGNPAAVHVQIKIEQIVVFTDRRDLNGS